MFLYQLVISSPTRRTSLHSKIESFGAHQRARDILSYASRDEIATEIVSSRLVVADVIGSLPYRVNFPRFQDKG
jgi:hypothetical protein